MTFKGNMTLPQQKLLSIGFVGDIAVMISTSQGLIVQSHQLSIHSHRCALHLCSYRMNLQQQQQQHGVNDQQQTTRKQRTTASTNLVPCRRRPFFAPINLSCIHTETSWVPLCNSSRLVQLVNLNKPPCPLVV